MTPEEIAAMQAENARLKTENETYKKPPAETPKPEPKPAEKPAPDADEDLTTKVRREQEEKAKSQGDAQKLEAALRFNLTSDKFISEHKSILPKEMADIFQAAEKESYDSPIEKANATKAALIQSFFSVQDNLDLTTPSHKAALEDYFRLTKKAKEERALDIYQNIFEPTVGMIKKIKKAEELTKAKGGYLTGSEFENAYKEKLMSGSRKHFLGDK